MPNSTIHLITLTGEKEKVDTAVDYLNNHYKHEQQITDGNTLAFLTEDKTERYDVKQISKDLPDVKLEYEWMTTNKWNATFGRVAYNDKKYKELNSITKLSARAKLQLGEKMEQYESEFGLDECL